MPGDRIAYAQLEHPLPAKDLASVRGGTSSAFWPARPAVAMLAGQSPLDDQPARTTDLTAR